ncbi:hypothetical protein PPERSA_01317 [Pseudocohnilembus persalinus]|uniref:Uncharacterized protein n=1 Tax=Pseudocohnilembus persalinus TaxID=266149 RepID=A0A0V0QGT8_PSEPJ|nr:hypothetical protein PPERSA_01317 [Pseudocohnilembus persalinus]|eukprot:KRX01414.1 hypothetical protein PPERSA_01317 [Pseudocohnilembus persalinus]
MVQNSIKFIFSDLLDMMKKFTVLLNLWQEDFKSSKRQHFNDKNQSNQSQEQNLQNNTLINQQYSDFIKDNFSLIEEIDNENSSYLRKQLSNRDININRKQRLIDILKYDKQNIQQSKCEDQIKIQDKQNLAKNDFDICHNQNHEFLNAQQDQQENKNKKENQHEIEKKNANLTKRNLIFSSFQQDQMKKVIQSQHVQKIINNYVLKEKNVENLMLESQKNDICKRHFKSLDTFNKENIVKLNQINMNSNLNDQQQQKVINMKNNEQKICIHTQQQQQQQIIDQNKDQNLNFNYKEQNNQIQSHNFKLNQPRSQSAQNFRQNKIFSRKNQQKDYKQKTPLK